MLSVIRRLLGGRQGVSEPSSAYELIGGEPVVQAIAQRFYQLMEEDPRYRPLRAQHPQDLNESADKLFMFLSGWLGGPPLFEQAHGHPMLRARHLSFRVDRALRDQWLDCMRRALNDTVRHKPGRQAILKALIPLADHMRNVDVD
ncbi:globin [Ferrimonas sediminicola]|uniref:Globin n=1 Tax=Ferrimonas sediminicola TaxID=2569538 RepID=A0A4U1BA89_9GAMM|nr:group II truncated hemoglobin [Ferrimonas sediminicola]TKB46962.1 globin [Ferrimonas sediminicola]